MLFMVGIEKPTTPNEAFGIIVPVFEKHGYACISAADSEDQILQQAKTAILEMLQEVLTDGHLLANLDVGFADFTHDYPDYSTWVGLDIDVDALKPKQKRININMYEPLLKRVDDFVVNHKNYKDRSDFIAKAAINEIAQHSSSLNKLIR